MGVIAVSVYLACAFLHFVTCWRQICLAAAIHACRVTGVLCLLSVVSLLTKPTDLCSYFLNSIVSLPTVP